MQFWKVGRNLRNNFKEKWEGNWDVPFDTYPCLIYEQCSFFVSWFFTNYSISRAIFLQNTKGYFFERSSLNPISLFLYQNINLV